MLYPTIRWFSSVSPVNAPEPRVAGLSRSMKVHVPIQPAMQDQRGRTAMIQDSHTQPQAKPGFLLAHGMFCF